MTTQLIPTLDEFAELARRGNVVPIFAEFIADNETPVSAFKKLDCSGGYSFLFESTEKNDESGRFSFVGADPRIVIKIYGHELQITELGEERRVERTGDPLDEIRKLIGALSVCLASGTAAIQRRRGWFSRLRSDPFL